MLHFITGCAAAVSFSAIAHTLRDDFTNFLLKLHYVTGACRPSVKIRLLCHPVRVNMHLKDKKKKEEEWR